MTDCTSCGGCAGGCGGCRSHVLLLTEPELRLLRQFAELAFLPAACTRTDETPVYLDGSENRAQTSAAILALQIKRLISVDFALPLKGFDYTGYEAWPIRGSMALTAAGQEALDSLDIQGCGEQQTAGRRQLPSPACVRFSVPKRDFLDNPNMPHYNQHIPLTVWRCKP